MGSVKDFFGSWIRWLVRVVESAHFGLIEIRRDTTVVGVSEKNSNLPRFDPDDFSVKIGPHGYLASLYLGVGVLFFFLKLFARGFNDCSSNQPPGEA